MEATSCWINGLLDVALQAFHRSYSGQGLCSESSKLLTCMKVSSFFCREPIEEGEVFTSWTYQWRITVPMEHHFLKTAMFSYNPEDLTISSEKNHVGIKLERSLAAGF